MLQSLRSRTHYPFWFEIAPLVLTSLVLMGQFFIFEDYTPHVPLVIGICITGLFMFLKGQRWNDMEHHMYRVMKVALPTVTILMCVGMLIAASIAAGTVQTLLSYGLSLLSPQTFLPVTCIIATLVSLATGTSWGTVGTVGLAMMGIGEALGVPSYWTAGAVVSGAIFGDKMSPLSDTTNLAPAVTDTEIWGHIKNMLPNTIPAYALTIVVYAVAGFGYQEADAAAFAMKDSIHAAISGNYKLHWLTLIPPVIVMVMAFRKYSVTGTLCAGIFSAALIAVCYQGVPLKDMSPIMVNGFSATTGHEFVDKLLSKGGILSMGWVITMTFLALGFVGCLEVYGTFRAILTKLGCLVKSRFSLVATSASIVLAVGLLIGEVYTSIVLPGRLMKSKFAELGYHRNVLSRVLEDWGTLGSPLIPWNNGGAFISATLFGAGGFSAFYYAPFAVFCWLTPLIGLLYAAFGWFTPKDPDGPKVLQDESLEDVADDVKEYMV